MSNFYSEILIPIFNKKYGYQGFEKILEIIRDQLCLSSPEVKRKILNCILNEGFLYSIQFKMIDIIQLVIIPD